MLMALLEYQVQILERCFLDNDLWEGPWLETGGNGIQYQRSRHIGYDSMNV